jgi:putative spermidine/putrescine transport system permease protein
LFLAVAVPTSLPSLYAVTWSFAGSETNGVYGEVTARWYRRVLADPAWQTSLAYSATVAAVSSAVGTLVLLLHFYCLRYATPGVERWAYALVLPMLLLPVVVYSLALRAVGGGVSIPEVGLLLLGHFVLVLPVQYYVFESSQDGIPSSLLFAGSTLGAGHLRNLLYVYTPLMRGAVATALVIGFFASFDDIVIATFVLDSSTVPAQRRLWNQFERSQDPSPAVVSTLLLGAYLVITAVRVVAAGVMARLTTDGGRVGR